MRSGRLLVPLLLLFLTFSASAELPVSSFELGAAAGEQRLRDLAGNGEQYLAVWSDEREPERAVLYATRLRRDGQPLDGTGLRLFDGYGDAAVAYGGGHWLVVHASLHYVLLDDGGAVVFRGRISEEFGGETLSAFFNGREFLVFHGSNDVRVAAIGVEGNVTMPPAVLASGPSGLVLYDVARDGDRYVVLYGELGALQVVVTSATGTPIRSGAVAIPTDYVYGVSIASSDGELAIVYRDGRTRALVALRLDRNGDGLGDVRVISAAGNGPFDLTAYGDGFMVYFAEGEEPPQLLRRFFSRDLVLGSATVALEQPGRGVFAIAAAGDATGTLAVAQLARRAQVSIESEIYSSSGHLLTRAAPAQRKPRIAGGNGTLVVWEENRGGAPAATPQTQIRAAFAGGDAFTVSPSTAEQRDPATAAEGDAFLAVWNEGERLNGRILPNGDVLEISAVYATAAAVASNGRDFVVAWIPHDDLAVHVARISTAGAILGRTVIGNLSWTTGPLAPAIACAGGECLVAWRNVVVRQTCPRIICYESEVFVQGVRLNGELQRIDASPLVLSGDEAVDDIVLAAAGDGSYAIAWEGNWTVTARTLARGGVLGARTTRLGRQPALARQDERWVVVRQQNEKLIAVRFSGQAAASDETLFDDTQSRFRPDAVADGSRVLLTYERTTRDEAAGGVPRVYVRSIEAPRLRMRAVAH